MSEPLQMTNLRNEVERWKAVAEANDRSYSIARDALEMTRKTLEEMTAYRDNAVKRLRWAEGERDKLKLDVRVLRADLAREKKARRSAQKGRRTT